MEKENIAAKDPRGWSSGPFRSHQALHSISPRELLAKEGPEARCRGEEGAGMDLVMSVEGEGGGGKEGRAVSKSSRVPLGLPRKLSLGRL